MKSRVTTMPNDVLGDSGRHPPRRRSSGQSTRHRQPRPVMVEPLLLRDDEAAVMLGVSRRTIHALASYGKLLAIHPAGMRVRRFARQDVQALADHWIRTAKEETASE